MLECPRGIAISGCFCFLAPARPSGSRRVGSAPGSRPACCAGESRIPDRLAIGLPDNKNLMTTGILQKTLKTITRCSGVALHSGDAVERSEEHTSELQSLMRISYAVFCFKKKKKRQPQ